MPQNQDSGYFGMRIGEALSAGAGHISEALQRKYMMQARMEEEALQREQQDKARNLSLGVEFSKAGVAYDPNDPASLHNAFTEFAKVGASRRTMDERKDAAQTKLIESQANMYDNFTGGAPTGAGPTIVKDAQGREYIVKPGPRGAEFQPVQPKAEKPMSEIAIKANLGHDSINKLIDLYSTGEFEGVGRKLKATLGSGMMGDALRAGDTKAQQLSSYQQQVTQALGRMVSGAVITPSEEKEFRSLLYSPLRKKEVNLENMKTLRDFFSTALPARIKEKYGEDVSVQAPAESSGMTFSADKIAEMEAAIARGE